MRGGILRPAAIFRFVIRPSSFGFDSFFGFRHSGFETTPGPNPKAVPMSQLPNEPAVTRKEGIPEGLWMRCPECEEMLFRKVVEEAFYVCPKCQYHFRLSARQRVDQL